MRVPPKRLAMLLVAATAVLAATLILVFSGGDQGPHRRTRLGATGQSDVQVAAGYLGISTAEVRRRLRSGLTLAQVAATGTGTSSAGLFDALLQARAAALRKQDLSSSQEHERLSAISQMLRSELRRARRGHDSELALASGYLGVEADALLSRQVSGRSLAEIASSTAGKSRSGLIKAITGPREGRLRAAASAHQITTATAKRAIGALRARTARDVDQKGVLGAG